MVGILAFHGDVAEHAAILRAMKVRHRDVRSAEDLRSCSHLIIPGGESTVMSKFLFGSGMVKELTLRVGEGSLAVYGTCAGAILLAGKVTGKNPPKTLGILAITVERNAYGTQLQSFDSTLRIRGIQTPVKASFIRAPVITRIGKGIEVLATHGEHPVLVRQGRILAGTFHPEVRSVGDVHNLFLVST